MTKIINTGERILLDKETPLMISRHFYAYNFTKDYAENRSVLDVGCGEGYGSYYLAGFAKTVLGIDYDKSILNYANAKYKRSNLLFQTIDIKSLDSLRDRFDVICSFQFIEHIHDTDIFLKNIKNLLNDTGIFICSTPNKKDASPESDLPLNKFHIKEYLVDEFKSLLEAHFKKVDIFALKRGKKLSLYRKLKKMGLFNLLPPSINPVNRFYKRISYNNFIITKDNLGTALDFIAVCRK